MSEKKKHFFIQQSKLNETPETVWALLTRPESYRRLAPPWLKFSRVNTDREFVLGATFEFRIGNGLLKGRWMGEVTHLRKGFLIGLRLMSPEKKIWQLWTKVLPGESRADCVLEDRIEYVSSPLSGKGQKKIENALRVIVYYKHRTLKNDLNVAARLGKPAHRRVLIAGGTGFIGTKLRDFLTMWGYEVEILSTRPETGNLYWDPSKGLLNPELLEKRDAIINLCGFPVACRWNRKNRQRILESRVDAAHLLLKTITRLNQPPKVYIQVSGCGYYGYGNSPEVTEENLKGSGFLADVCEKWEAEVRNQVDLPTRWIIARLGAVISPEGGALAKMLPVFRSGMGGRLGSGKQYFPWISVNDLMYFFLTAMEDKSYHGTFNACAPDTPDNRTFTRSLASALGKPAIFPVPEFVLSTLYGPMAHEMLLGGVRVVSQNAINHGFGFFDNSIQEYLLITLGK